MKLVFNTVTDPICNIMDDITDFTNTLKNVPNKTVHTTTNVIGKIGKVFGF